MKKFKEINITRATNKYDYWFIEKIKAEPVTIKGFEKLNLFVHINKFGNGMFAPCNGNKYVLTEGTTGLIVAGGNTKNVVIKSATEFLNKQGVISVKAQIAKRLKQMKLKPYSSIQRLKANYASKSII